MTTARKLRRLTFGVTEFLKDYNDAASTGMSIREFCECTGLPIGTLHGRLRILAARGVILPMLKGMRRRTKMGRLLGGCPPIPVTEPQPDVAPAAEPERVAAPSFEIHVGSGF